jgi:hypothetical protein
MAEETYPIRFINGTGEFVEGAVSLDEEADDDLCRLMLRFPYGQYNAEACDYFEAMCLIRRELETTGWYPFCYGACRNVFPSGMSRGMGSRGLLAYKLQLGKQARSSDLVGIFDFDADVHPVAVDEQAEFYEQWLRSLSTC